MMEPDYKQKDDRGNTPKGLFEAIKAKHTLPTVICQIHKPCQNIRQCSNVSKKEVLNFDAIKREEDKESGISDTRKSVDAITYSDRDTYFCFVEFKGWSVFIERNKNAEVGREALGEQIKKYNLEQKLTDSIEICMEIVNKDMFKDVGVCFIVVTDISDSSKLFSDQLTYLSATSSPLTATCNALLKKNMDNITITGMDDIKKMYLSCQNFDEQMKTI